MFKLLIIVILLITGIIRLIANRRVKRHSKKLSKYAGAVTSFEALNTSFDTLIKQFSYTNIYGEKLPETSYVQNALDHKYTGKYKLHSVTGSAAGDEYFFVADAKVKDFVPGRTGGRYVDKLYPASLLLKMDNPTAGQLSFYGPFPEDKRHQMLQQDMATLLFDMLSQERKSER